MAKTKRLSSPSSAWALMIVLGAHHFFEQDSKKKWGFWRSLLSLIFSILLVFPMLFRLYYAWMYWEFEGVYYNEKTGEIIVKDFDEPENIIDLGRILTGRGGRRWINERNLPVTLVDDFDPSKLLLGWMSRFQCGTSGGASMIPVIIANPRQTKARIQKLAAAFDKAAASNRADDAMSQKKRRLKEEAEYQLDLEEEKKKLRSRRRKKSVEKSHPPVG